jgi:Asp-tRNA(Asn)/Glu-tRNA(Gln) amidotransferase A subunit family amidase
VGGQVIAPRFGEQVMFRIAYALESELGGAAHA